MQIGYDKKTDTFFIIGMNLDEMANLGGALLGFKLLLETKPDDYKPDESIDITAGQMRVGIEEMIDGLLAAKSFMGV